jgi:hypothetical protein
MSYQVGIALEVWENKLGVDVEVRILTFPLIIQYRTIIETSGGSHGPYRPSDQFLRSSFSENALLLVFPVATSWKIYREQEIEKFLAFTMAK